MSSLNFIKRKKLKTRKCLNMLRKSWHMTKVQDIDRKDCSLKLRNKWLNNQRLNHNSITSNRLTLDVFPRTVRSETITRPLLEEIKHEGTDLNKNMRYELRNHTVGSVSTAQVQNVLMSVENNTSYIEILKDYAILSSDDLLVVSPLAPSQVLISNNEQADMSITTTSSSSEDNNNYRKYEEFMSEISLFLKNSNLSNQINKDIMSYNKKRLRELYIESCQKEYENNVLNCIKGAISISQSPREVIVGNPKQYIQLTNCHLLEDSKPSTSVSQSLNSPIAMHSAHSSIEAFTFCAHSEIYDTPDYAYYPHKLK